MQLIAENAELRDQLGRMMSEKAKYKQRTKRLLEALEEERGHVSQNADCLEGITEELQQMAGEKQSIIEDRDAQIQELQQRVLELRSQLDESRQGNSALQRSAFKSGITAACNNSNETAALQQINSQLITTISAFVQIFNYTVDQLDFRKGELPGYLQRVYKQLLV